MEPGLHLHHVGALAQRGDVLTARGVDPDKVAAIGDGERGLTLVSGQASNHGFLLRVG